MTAVKIKWIGLLGILIFSCDLLAYSSFSPLVWATLKNKRPLTFCQGDSTILYIDPPAPGATYQWKNAGININGATQDTLLVFTAGSYSLEVSDNNGTTTFGPLVVVVNFKPVVDFSFSPTTGCGKTKIYFTNLSTDGGNPSSTINLTYTWNFGDGSAVSNDPNPNHTYKPVSGTGIQPYTVTLTVTNSLGCSNTNVKTLTIEKGPDATINGPGAITINGEPYFKICGATSQTFNFTNASSTAGSNTQYIIKWGDGSLDYSSTNFSSPLTHTYPVGLKYLTFIVYRAFCVDSTVYNIFVGNIPAGGIAGLGGSTICAGTAQKFAITNYITNPPGTQYIVDFKDGTNVTYSHPPPDTILHTFALSSCGTTSSSGTDSYPNAYGAFLKITNPCGQASGSIVPIYVSDRPSAKIGYSRDTICEGQSIVFQSIGNAGKNVENGTCTSGKVIWRIQSIAPGGSWTVQAGSLLGNDFGLLDPSLWNPGTYSISIIFNKLGTYKITLITANNTLCGVDSTEKIICVNKLPFSSYTLDKNTGCAPLIISTSNLTAAPFCGQNKYVWTVTYAPSTGCDAPAYSFSGGSDKNSVNPQFLFSGPGTYTISLVTIAPANSCQSAPSTTTIIIKDKPKISITSPLSICEGKYINPVASATCFQDTATYIWQFPGGAPTSSKALSPGPIVYNTFGDYTLFFSDSNVCGVSLITRPIRVVPIPKVDPLPNQFICHNNNTTAVNFTGNLGGTKYNWANNTTSIGLADSGQGNISSFTAKNTGTTPVTATITVTPTYSDSGSSCPGIAQSFTLTVYPIPKVDTILDFIYCNGALTSSLSFKGSPLGTKFTWISDNAAIGLATSGVDSIPVFTATNNGTAPIVANISVIPTYINNGVTCSGTIRKFKITVNPTPDINPISSLTVCSEIVVPSVVFSSNITGTTYKWTNSTTSVGLAASGVGNLPSFIAKNSTSNPVVATFIVTPLYGSCEGKSKMFTITVNPAPSIQFSKSSQTICSGSTSTDILISSPTPGATINWTSTIPAGISGVITSGTTNIPPQTLINTTTGAVTIIYKATATISGATTCSGSTSNDTIIVNPIPVINKIPDQVVCSGKPVSVALSSNITGATYSWVADAPASITGAANGTGISFSQTLTNTSSSSEEVFYYITPKYTFNSVNCSGEPDTFQITVNPIPDVKASILSQPVCSDSNIIAINLTGSVVGTTFSWTRDNPSVTGTIGLTGSGNVITGSLKHNLSSTQRVIFSIIPSANLCAGSILKDTVWVYPTPTATVSSSYQTVCSGKPITNIGITGTAINTTFKWTRDNTINVIGMPNSGTGNIISGTLDNITSIVQKVIFTITPTNNGCEGQSKIVTITVNPKIEAVASINSQTICSGVTLQPINLSSTVIGTTFSWVRTNTTNVTGIPASGSGSQIIGTLINGTSSQQFVQFTITPTANGCVGNDIYDTIYINPAAIVQFNKAPQTICSGSTSQAVSIGSLTPNVSFTWIATAPASITGAIPSGTNTINAQLLINAGTSPDSVFYQVVASTTGNAVCSGDTAKYFITVNPVPQVIPDLNTDSICSGTYVNLKFNSPNSLTTYDWTYTTTCCITGAINGTGNSVNQTLTSSSNDNQIITYRITPRLTYNKVACDGSAVDVPILLYPSPTLSSPNSPPDVCSNTTFSYQATSLTPNTTFRWSRAAVNGISNSAGNGTGSNINESLDNTTTDPLTVKYSFVLSANGCENNQMVALVVNPNAKASFSVDITVGCTPYKITEHFTLQHYPNANSTNYEWYVDGVLIGIGKLPPAYSITQPGATVEISLVAKSLYGCKNDTTRVTVRTVELPAPSFTIDRKDACGPTKLYFTNTTKPLSVITNSIYQWKFGNGVTSSLVQPDSISFLPNPNYLDTTYFIRLNVQTSCSVFSFVDSVVIRSKPSAIFSTNKTYGCSPLPVTFYNGSRGIDLNYIWDFGDGSPLLITNSKDVITHTYSTTIQQTYTIRLKISNSCGSDSFKLNIVVVPNDITLNVSIDGITTSGCAPLTTRFINNSTGVNLFNWDFGDNTTYASAKNAEVITHTYTQPGKYQIRYYATNGCSQKSDSQEVQVFRTPKPAFKIQSSSFCIGNIISLVNNTDTATTYAWDFGDGTGSTLQHPSHSYTRPGAYSILLIATMLQPNGVICQDSTRQNITIKDTLLGNISISDSILKCKPFTIKLSNLFLPSSLTTWTVSDGTILSGDSVNYTFAENGTYQVRMISVAPGGCVYQASKQIIATSPIATLSYLGGTVCNAQSVRFEAVAYYTDSIRWDFGDGSTRVTTDRIIYHTYTNPGVYLPKIVLLAGNNGNCRVAISGVDSLRIDRVTAGFTYSLQTVCDSTLLLIKDTSTAFSPLVKWEWTFGDLQSSTEREPRHAYTSSGTYTVQLRAISYLGCTDEYQVTLPIKVYTTPVVDFAYNPDICLFDSLVYIANVQSNEPITFTRWVLSNGVSATGNTFTTTFLQPGTYLLALIAGTTFGCYDTIIHQLTVHDAPNLIAGGESQICLGQSAQLSANGSTNYSWSPATGLSCNNCANPIATPTVTTQYVVTSSNSFGCRKSDSVLIQVIQPFHLITSPSDSLCLGESITLSVGGGATLYTWSPASSLSCSNCTNPVATPDVTTRYRVIGEDLNHCFSDTGFVNIVVGNQPKVSLGSDQLLSTGTLFPLTSLITNGPVSRYTWIPAQDLSCSNCKLPVATIKKDICYTLEAETVYGCKGSDTICINVFCENTQVFIPNAFTPDGDGLNDVLMVRGSGIKMIKQFIIFNRWGQVVFERQNFLPNDPSFGWNGKVNGVPASPDVFVYLADVVCENDLRYAYKGNVTLIK